MFCSDKESNETQPKEGDLGDEIFGANFSNNIHASESQQPQQQDESAGSSTDSEPKTAGK